MSAAKVHAANIARAVKNYVRRVVDQAPPLTAEQRERIASLLRPESV